MLALQASVPATRSHAQPGTQKDTPAPSATSGPRCRIKPYLIKAPPHAAPLARRQRRAQPWEARPGARRAASRRARGSRWLTQQTGDSSAAVFLGDSIFLLPAAASRSPSGRRCAIGFAEPRPGVHSPRISAPARKREVQDSLHPGSTEHEPVGNQRRVAAAQVCALRYRSPRCFA